MNGRALLDCNVRIDRKAKESGRVLRRQAVDKIRVITMRVARGEGDARSELDTRAAAKHGGREVLLQIGVKQPVVLRVIDASAVDG